MAVRRRTASTSDGVASRRVAARSGCSEPAARHPYGRPDRATRAHRHTFPLHAYVELSRIRRSPDRDCQPRSRVLRRLTHDALDGAVEIIRVQEPWPPVSRAQPVAPLRSGAAPSPAGSMTYTCAPADAVARLPRSILAGDFSPPLGVDGRVEEPRCADADNNLAAALAFPSCRDNAAIMSNTCAPMSSSRSTPADWTGRVVDVRAGAPARQKTPCARRVGARSQSDRQAPSG